MYLMLILNLFKITKKFEWNPFKSGGWFELIVIAAVAIPLIYAFTGEKKEQVEIAKKENNKN